MPIAIEFDHVSKYFVIKSHRTSSFRETVVNFFSRQKRLMPDEHLHILKDVSFQLEAGKTFGFIGANGAGKSSLLKLITGILEPSAGQIRVSGRIAALLELGAGFHPDLTGRENVYLNAAILGLSRDEVTQKLDSIVAFSELEDFIDMPVKHYSSGMYVRLGFSVAVNTNPDILLVDEVLSVGDITFQRKCMERISELRRRGVTIVLVSHGLGTVQTFCDEVIWLEDGCIQAAGGATDVVMAYTSAMAKKQAIKDALESETQDEPENNQRWGTGKVQIADVMLCDASGQAATAFVTGSPLEIRLYYRAAERVRQPVFGLGVHHQTGTHLSGPNTGFAGLDIPFIEGDGYVSYYVPSLMLLEGDYLLSVAVHDHEDIEMYDYHDRLYPLKIYRGDITELYGLITMNGTWSLGDGCFVA